MKSSLIIATRQSPLALGQANIIKSALEELYPNCNITLLGLTTEGDRFLSQPLNKVGGKGLFVKELEHALMEGRADIAVHSMKDLPAEHPEELIVPVISKRLDPHDVLVTNHAYSITTLPAQARVGSSSLRRQCQLHKMRPDLQIENLRGNVQTRLQALDEGKFDAIVLAAAGLKRLNLAHRISMTFTPEQCLPAIGQGALGVQCRANDLDTLDLIEPLNHADTQSCIRAERAMNALLGGSCQVPIAGYAQRLDGTIHLKGLIGTPDGKQILTSEYIGNAEDPEAIGEIVARDLIAKGANEILQRYSQ